MTLRLAFLPIAALLLIGALAAACGDDNGDNGDDVPEATEPARNGEPTEPPDEPDNGNGAPAGGDGSATLTVGDQVFEFTGLFCGFSPDETRNDRVSFTLGAFGESATGARTQLDASIQDTDEQGRYEGEGTIHSVTLNDIDDFENPSVSLEAVTGLIGSPDFTVQVDGKNVSASANFDDGTTDELDAIPGTLEATCP